MSAAARSSLPTLNGPLAARLAAESARRGVPASDLLEQAVEAYLDDDPADERALNVGGDLPPEDMYRAITEGEAEAVRNVLTHPPAPTGALRKLVRGL